MLRFVEWALFTLVALVNAVVLSCVILAGWADYKLAHRSGHGYSQPPRQ
jgi:uncharacterized membrane protein